jgi:hypothetical protein
LAIKPSVIAASNDIGVKRILEKWCELLPDFCVETGILVRVCIWGFLLLAKVRRITRWSVNTSLDGCLCNWFCKFIGGNYYLVFVCCDFEGKDFDGAALAPVESINVLQMESTLIQLEQVLLASKRSLKSGLLCVAAGNSRRGCILLFVWCGVKMLMKKKAAL